MNQLLTGKHVLPFGAGGSIAAAVAKEFARGRDGARSWGSGRTG